MSRAEVINWCPPLHHEPGGPTLPSGTALQSPFVAVIVGASKGMGAHMALAFAQAGASGLVITGRDEHALESVAAKASRIAVAAPGEGVNIKVKPVICDVLKDDDVKRLATVVEAEFGRIDCLILNAGTPVSLQPTRQQDGSTLLDWPKGVHDHALADFRTVVDTNLMSGVTCMHHLLPLVVAARDGGPQTVVVVSSSAANNVDPRSIPVAYSLSKMANARLAELVHEGYGGGTEDGLVVSIQPGSVMTEGARAKLPEGRGWETRTSNHGPPCALLLYLLTIKVELIDSVELAGGFCVWLCREKRTWLSGRYIDSRWDVEELERRKDEIVAKDLLKFRLQL